MKEKREYEGINKYENITLEIDKDGRLYLPVQSEVEDIALETLDDDNQIYFEPIPLMVGGEKYGPYLMYDKYLGGWEILNIRIKDKASSVRGKTSRCIHMI